MAKDGGVGEKRWCEAVGNEIVPCEGCLCACVKLCAAPSCCASLNPCCVQLRTSSSPPQRPCEVFVKLGWGEEVALDNDFLTTTLPRTRNSVWGEEHSVRLTPCAGGTDFPIFIHHVASLTLCLLFLFCVPFILQMFPISSHCFPSPLMFVPNTTSVWIPSLPPMCSI